MCDGDSQTVRQATMFQIANPAHGAFLHNVLVGKPADLPGQRQMHRIGVDLKWIVEHEGDASAKAMHGIVQIAGHPRRRRRRGGSEKIPASYL